MGLSDPPLRFGFNTHAQPKLTAESKCESFFSKLLFIICKRFFLKDLFVFATGIFFIIKWTHKLPFFHFRILYRAQRDVIFTDFDQFLLMSCSPHVNTRNEKIILSSEFRIPKYINDFDEFSDQKEFLYRYLVSLEQFDYLKLFVKIRNWYLAKKNQAMNFEFKI